MVTARPGASANTHATGRRPAAQPELVGKGRPAGGCEVAEQRCREDYDRLVAGQAGQQARGVSGRVPARHGRGRCGPRHVDGTPQRGEVVGAFGPDERFQPRPRGGIGQVDGLPVDAEPAGHVGNDPEDLTGCRAAAQLAADNHLRCGGRGLLIAAEAVAVTVEQQVEPGAGTGLSQHQRPRPAPLDVSEANAQGHAAPNFVGLGGPVAQQPDQFAAVLGAERGKRREQMRIDRAQPAVGGVVGGQRRVWVGCQEQVHRREQQARPPLFPGGLQEQAQRIVVVGDPLAQPLVHQGMAAALGRGEDPEKPLEQSQFIGRAAHRLVPLRGHRPQSYRNRPVR